MRNYRAGHKVQYYLGADCVRIWNKQRQEKKDEAHMWAPTEESLAAAPNDRFSAHLLCQGLFIPWLKRPSAHSNQGASLSPRQISGRG
jgi:hypothetical protein